MKNVDIIERLSIELARTQMINNSMIRVLEKKNILSEQEVLEELQVVVKEAIENMIPREVEENEVNDFFITNNPGEIN
jgi:ABC-type iron transport system FetAB ATPase subunit